jgi:hypothetical protein
LADPRVFWCERRLHDIDEAHAAYLAPNNKGGLAIFAPRLHLDGFGPQPVWDTPSFGYTFATGTPLSQACDEAFPGFTRTPARLGPGEYFPRIWRPGAPDAAGMYRSPVLFSARTFRLLVKQLHEVFEVVEPTAKNAESSGHLIRQLLLTASMDVESGWKAVLNANHYSKKGGGHLNRGDYVRLLKPMRLDSYTVRLTMYPDWPEMKPFAGWTASDQSTLWWYDAYNATKHDREVKLNAATLKAAVYAVAATYVMLNAQFGTPIYAGPLDLRDFADFAIEADRITEKEFSYIPNQDGSFTAVDCNEF